MKTRIHIPLAVLLSLVTGIVAAAPLGTAFTYQGKLADGGNLAQGIYDFRFAIYDAAESGAQIGTAITNSPVDVTNGLFTVSLDFGGGVFTGNARWLDIAVRTNGGGAFTPLAPRQPLTPAPYALYAPNAGAATTATTASSAAAVAANGVANASLQANAVSSDKIADGAITAADLSPAVLSNTFWRLGGNAGTTPGTHFLGTTGNQPLEFKVNNLRALRVEDNGDGSDSGTTPDGAPNFIGGSPVNSVAAGVVGATISGGGATNWDGMARPNSVAADYATIGGGISNTIQPYANNATLGGGNLNKIQTNAEYATIGGGGLNTIQTDADFATIGGGVNNTIQPHACSATIPGGQNNSATNYAFAAGRRAKANHTGAFVWADSTDADYASTTNNQFLIRASGGVGIGANNPQTALHVAGTVTATSFSGSAAGLTGLNASQLASGAVPDARLSANVSLLGGSIESGEITDGTITAADVQANTFWRLGGNAGTTPGTHFLGTTGNQPLELKVNNLRALRVEDNGDGSSDPDTTPDGAPNFIGGSPANSVTAGVVGATISGGGASNWNGRDRPNSIAADYATIAGGYYNTIQTYADSATIGGGYDNTIQTNANNATIGGGYYNTIQTNAIVATIGGGYYNTIRPYAYDATIGGGHYNTIEFDADFATIGGGSHNTAGAFSATVAGGHRNAALGGDSTVGGGYTNAASGYRSTVPGGHLNVAGGDYSFAAGHRANANHTGAFVWADSTDADFASTRNDEFNLRATGGVRIQSDRGISLNAANAPLITRGYDPFTSGAYTGLGRWGLFMEPFNLVIGIPNLVGRNFQVAKYETDGTRTTLMTLDQSGNLTIAGAYSPSSDRHAKENFAGVNPVEVLEKVAALPISRWNFKQDPEAEHLGPMAQDFHAAFGLGTDDKHIATVDADGVALAAIQGLNQKLEATRTENAELKQRLERLERLLARQPGH
jgi:hypothetical protein